MICALYARKIQRRTLLRNFLFERFLLSQRTLFDRDGLFLPKTYKGELMKILEALPDAGLEPENMNENEVWMAVVDGMVFLNALVNPDWVKTCLNLACHLINEFSREFHNQAIIVHLYSTSSINLQMSRTSWCFRAP